MNDELNPTARRALATELSGKLADALKPAYEPLRLGLWELEKELVELHELRDQAVEDGELPATLAVIDQQIAEYHSREVKSVDKRCATIRAYEDAAAQAKREADRLADRAKALEARAKAIKESTLRAMQDHGITKLETPTNRLRVQKNGGREPLEVTEMEERIPEVFRLATVTMSLRLLRSICKDLSEVECREIFKTVTSVDVDAIRAALKEVVPCIECAGPRDAECTVCRLRKKPLGRSAPMEMANSLCDDECPGYYEGPRAPYLWPSEECPRCEGRGTVPRTIEGARLLERGVHLRVG